MAFVVAALAIGAPASANDYPTAARAEYVFACMAANGQTPEILQKCSCAIDAIAESLPYQRYEAAETVKRMRLTPGVRAEPFHSGQWAADLVDELERAQASATLRCF